MTCVVAAIKDNKTYMAADSMGFDAHRRIRRKDQKLFIGKTSFGQKFMIGFTTSYRMGQLLKYQFVPTGYDVDETSDESLHNYMVSIFVKQLMDVFKLNGFGEIKEGDESSGGTFIVAISDKLFIIESDFQVGQPLANYISCGSGSDYAHASLYTSQRMYPHLPTKDRLQLAIECAIEHSNTVGGEIHYLELEHI